jgi:hypothetical protein
MTDSPTYRLDASRQVWRDGDNAYRMFQAASDVPPKGLCTFASTADDGLVRLITQTEVVTNSRIAGVNASGKLVKEGEYFWCLVQGVTDNDFVTAPDATPSHGGITRCSLDAGLRTVHTPNAWWNSNVWLLWWTRHYRRGWLSFGIE